MDAEVIILLSGWIAAALCFMRIPSKKKFAESVRREARHMISRAKVNQSIIVEVIDERGKRAV